MRNSKRGGGGGERMTTMSRSDQSKCQVKAVFQELPLLRIALEESMISITGSTQRFYVYLGVSNAYSSTLEGMAGRWGAAVGPGRVLSGPGMA